MKTLELTLNYQTSTPDDSLWVRLVQEGIDDDVATLKETADAIDEVFSIDACSEDKSSGTPDEEGVNEAAKKVFDYTICKSDYDGNIEVRVRVIRSNPELPYNVHVAGGEVLSTESVSEEITLKDFVEGSNSLQLSYPVISPVSFLWMNDLTSTGDSTIQRSGNTLYWKDQAAGTIQSKFLTSYDVLNIKVYGIDGNVGKATVRVVYQGQIESLETQIPDAYDTDRSHCGVTFELVDNQTVTCYRTVVKTQRCGCSKVILSTDTYDEVVSCPDYAPKKCQGAITECLHFLGTFAIEEFVKCDSDYYLPGTSIREDVSDPEWYKGQCCEYPSGQLPDCEARVESYTGGHKLALGEAYYRAMYGDTVRFVPVSPEGNCGQHIIRQVIDPKDCCDRIPPLRWDDAASPDYIAADSTAWVYVRDGLPPYKWHISSEQGGVWFVDGGGSDHESEVPFAALRSGDSVCGIHTITVVDDCGTEVQGAVLGPEGHWEGEGMAMRDIATSGYLHFGHGALVDDGYDIYVELMVAGVKYRQSNSTCDVIGTDGKSKSGEAGCPTDRSQFSAWWTDELGGDPTPSYRPMPGISEDVLWTDSCGTCYGYDRYGVLTFDPHIEPCGSHVKTAEMSPYLVGECVYLTGTKTCKMLQVRFCYGDFSIWRWKC